MLYGGNLQGLFGQIFFKRVLVNSRSLTQEPPDSHRLSLLLSLLAGLRKCTWGRCSVLCTDSERGNQFSVENVIPQERTVSGNRQGTQSSRSKFVVTISVNQLRSWQMTECHLNTWVLLSVFTTSCFEKKLHLDFRSKQESLLLVKLEMPQAVAAFSEVLQKTEPWRASTSVAAPWAAAALLDSHQVCNSTGQSNCFLI